MDDVSRRCQDLIAGTKIRFNGPQKVDTEFAATTVHVCVCVYVHVCVCMCVCVRAAVVRVVRRQMCGVSDCLVGQHAYRLRSGVGRDGSPVICFDDN